MSGKNTLDLIQQEIKETLEREDELRKLYNNQNGVNYNNDVPATVENNNKIFNCNGTTPKTATTNGGIKSQQPKNGFRLFAQQNAPTKGLMHKFLKNKGKVNATIKSTPTTNNWSYEEVFTPAKISVEKGQHVRKGFVSAEEKMKKELQEFQKREEELRKERRKSQPNLMAALQDEEQYEDLIETQHSSLKSAKSMANLQDEDAYFRNSAPSSLKPSKSLAELCDISDDEREIPGTYSLIMQFENMKKQQDRG